MTQRGRKGSKQLLLDDRVDPFAPQPPPSHFQEPERRLWKAIVSEHNFTSVTSLTLLAVAMEAAAVMRHSWDRIEKTDSFGPKDILLHTNGRAAKTYVNAMRLLKVIPR